MSDKGMLLTIIVPCFNEARSIGPCLESLLSNDFDRSQWEILVIDGVSGDGTRQVVQTYCDRYPFVRLLDNPYRTKPKALNLGIRAARGEIIMRIDAHATYARNYVRHLTETLIAEGVDNVGGIRKTHISTERAVGMAVGVAISNPLAIGNAHSRADYVREKRLVDTVFCGCYRRVVFDKIGLFNEHLIRTQDREFNARLCAAKGKVLLDPAAECTYYPRTGFWQYLDWTFKGAFWLFYAWRFTSVRMIGWRNLIPAIFVAYMLMVFVLALISWAKGVELDVLPSLQLLAVPGVLYLAVLAIEAVRIAKRFARRALIWAFPLVVFATHVAYGAGSICGAILGRARGKLRNV